MSLIFVEGFDDGLQSSKWTSWGNNVQTSIKRTGTGASNSSGGDYYYALLAGDQSATLIVGMAQYHSALPSSGRRHWRLQADVGVTTHVAFTRNSSGAIEAYRGGTFGDTLLGTTANNLLPINTWNYVETKVVLNDTTGAITIKVNGVTALTLTNIDTKNGGTAVVFDRLHFGSTTGDAAAMYVDDLYLCNAAGSVNNDFVGDCSVLTIFPDGNGNSSQWVGSDADSVNNYLLVDENPDPNTSDYVESGTATNIDTYSFGNMTGTADSIVGVVSRVYAAKSDAGAQLMRQTTRIGGVNYPHGTDIALSTSYTGYGRIMETSPATSVAWTQSEIDGTEFGVEAR